MTTEERILELVRERDQAAQEAVDLKTRIAELERILADPASVWANMLTGKIARPQALDHYEECKAMVEKLEEQERVLRAAPALLKAGRAVLASAHPNKKEHPKMAAAFEELRKAVAEATAPNAEVSVESDDMRSTDLLAAKED